MVFYRKWRPQTLGEVAGQEPVTRTLLNALQAGKVAHAYLFSGPRGTGKTSTGRILAKAVNCLNNGGKGEPCNTCSLCQAITQGRSLDVIEIDAASNRGIDEARQLREWVAFAPSQAQYKVFIVDEVHMLTPQASNALLKTLEEPPPYVLFILATTEPHNVLPTILSRCQHFSFRRLSLADISARLEFIAQQEGLSLPAEALRLIARSATGSMRDAENVLEQLVNYYGAHIELDQARELLGLGASIQAKELVRCLVARDLTGGLGVINQVNSDGLDLRGFHREVVEYLRQLLLVKAGSAEAVEATAEEIAELKKLASPASWELLLKATRLFSRADVRLDNYSPLPLELALVESLEGQAAQPQKQVTVPQAKPQEVRTPTPSYAGAPGKGPVSAPAKPPEVKPAEAKAVSAVTEGELSLESLRQNWKKFVDSLRGKGSRGDLDARLRSACEPTGLEGEELELSFRHKAHFEQVNDPKYIYLVELGLKEFFGQPLKLKLSPPPPAKPLNQEPLVQAALEMGARIVEEEER